MHKQFVLDTQRYLLNACYTMIEEEQREQRSIRTDPIPPYIQRSPARDLVREEAPQMAVDEFGREIPAFGELGHGRSADDDWRAAGPGDDGGGGGRGGSAQGYGDGEPVGGFPRSTPGPSEGRRGRSRSRSRSRSHNRSRSRSRERGGGDRHQRGARRGGGGRRRSGGRSRSRSPPGYRRRNHGHGHGGGGKRGAPWGGRAGARPSERYASAGPLLCEYLWKEESGGKDGADRQPKAESEVGAGDHPGLMDEGDAGDQAAPTSGSAQDDKPPSENGEGDEKDGTEAGDAEARNAEAVDRPPSYPTYVSSYCLKYVRTFFNEHLDDEWFRRRYSPLELRREAQAERIRGATEARDMIGQARESLARLGEGNTAAVADEEEGKDGAVGGEKLPPPQCDFVLGARLSGGTKPVLKPSAGPGAGYASSVPRTQLHSIAAADRVIRVHDVPPHVTDGHLVRALADHTDGGAAGIVSVFGTSVGEQPFGGGYDRRRGEGDDRPLDRTCFVVMGTKETREKLLENLSKTNMDSHSRHHRHNHRESDRASPSILELDVECTDPYGRYDVDVDGKGGGPSKAEGGGPEDEPGKLPVRRATVFVATVSLADEQPVLVLSAAVSSATRIGRDGAAAITIARAFDVAAAIPRGMRLDELLELLFPSGTGALEVGGRQQQEAEDILDVSIAYLRRVHLFSFYNGCTSAPSFGNVLAGRHAAGTIHTRLAGADAILKEAAEDADNMPVEAQDLSNEGKETDIAGVMPPVASKDLLVRRLDESIARALDESTSSVIATTCQECPVDEETNALATEIEAAEEAAKPNWFANHFIDDDGRARCSFESCRKLFKDQKFLDKHLSKKHSEHLRAELAKCHDKYMMKRWDAENERPVPPVLVDCGSRFGLVPSAVLGAEKPAAADPEPDLWEKEEERMRRNSEEEERRRERRAAAEASGGDYDMDAGDRGAKRPRSTSAAFVDVDEMKDEKVELSFDAADIQPPKKKKKKKKRKSLL